MDREINQPDHTNMPSNTDDDTIFTSDDDASPLVNVRDGMDVIDVSGEKIGTVDEFQIGNPDAATDAGQQMTGGQDTFVEDVADVFVAGRGLPEALRESLVRLGYIKIDTGLFHKDKYATSDQIASVSEDAVHLNVDKDMLPTP